MRVHTHFTLAHYETWHFSIVPTELIHNTDTDSKRMESMIWPSSRSLVVVPCSTLRNVKFTYIHMWGWAVSSQQECEETQMSRSHWEKVCCCYDALHLKSKYNKCMMHDKIIWSTMILELRSPTYRCHWQWLFPRHRLNFQILWASENIWCAGSSVWKRCVCSGPLIDTLWTVHVPVFWWEFLHLTMLIFVNGCRGTGVARTGK